MIGTTAAIIGGSLISGGLGLAASKKNSKAIDRGTAAQERSATEQIGFQRETYAQNTANLSPFMTRGNAAGDTINAALGIGGSVTAPQAPAGALTVPYNGGYPDAAQYPGYNPGALNSYNPAQFRMQALDAYPVNDAGAAPGVAPQQQAAPAGTAPQQAALSAYEMFKQSTGYTTRFDEGMRGLNAGFAGAGVVQSGAAAKAALRYGQNFASNEFGNWLGYLGNQQGIGFAGASALAGVSQGAADRMGAISQNSADTATQAAVARAQNQGALFNSLAGTVGTAVGALSSYSRPPAAYAPALRTVPAYGYG